MLHRVCRIRDVYPDPTTKTSKEGKNFAVLPFGGALNFTKPKNYFIFEQVQKKI
jgi:hypothetical protein